MGGAQVSDDFTLFLVSDDLCCICESDHLPQLRSTCGTLHAMEAVSEWLQLIHESEP